MISFWAQIDEADIEAFAGTLFLPSYMSHLQLAPFRFSNQPSNPDGRQSLILTYVGEGRVEELPVSPKKYAMQLLHFAFPRLSPEEVRISDREAIWNWTVPPPPGNFSSNTLLAPRCREESVESRLKIFFEPIRKTLVPGFQPPTFSPFQTYVSVSRKELFIGMQILSAYFSAWVEQLTGERSDSDCPILTSLEISVGGFAFTTPKLGGELLVENDAVFLDLLRFAALEGPLGDIAELLVPDLNSPDTQFGEAGILLKLVHASSASK